MKRYRNTHQSVTTLKLLFEVNNNDHLATMHSGLWLSCECYFDTYHDLNITTDQVHPS